MIDFAFGQGKGNVILTKNSEGKFPNNLLLLFYPPPLSSSVT